MSRPSGNKSAKPRKNGNSLLMGILLGMIVGVAMAAGLAWYIMKSPSPFVNKGRVDPLVETISTVLPKHTIAPVETAASGEAVTKQPYEFYKILTDKPGVSDYKHNPPAVKPKAVAPRPAAKYLQAGAFSHQADAENLKARLAMKGLEASVQQVRIPGKGVLNRVRVGPFKNEKEMGDVQGMLTLNGLEAKPVH